MEHLNQNDILDLHIKNRNDVDFIDLLVRYEDALAQWYQTKRDFKDSTECDAAKILELEQEIDRLKLENSNLKCELEDEELRFQALEEEFV